MAMERRKLPSAVHFYIPTDAFEIQIFVLVDHEQVIYVSYCVKSKTNNLLWAGSECFLSSGSFIHGGVRNFKTFYAC